MLQERGSCGHLPCSPFIKTGGWRDEIICLRSRCKTTKISKKNARDSSTQGPTQHLTVQVPRAHERGPCLRDRSAVTRGPCTPAVSQFHWLAQKKGPNCMWQRKEGARTGNVTMSVAILRWSIDRQSPKSVDYPALLVRNASWEHKLLDTQNPESRPLCTGQRTARNDLVVALILYLQFIFSWDIC